ncbi:MAG: hypothetical protein CMO80_11975 [Verrucomicrobiales bacterium]|nr:hypothetical protein [Verrucomicrobiales bacterium]|tara:strand:+ start:1173 stop:2936 length:1764 start_codon:yes stop_codon:yes gene_type:complete
MHLDNEKNLKTPAGVREHMLLLWTICLIFVVCMVGCSTAEYRRQADQENYKIIAQVEQQMFGKTNAFSIDTEYSKRDPQEFEVPEFVKQRMVAGELWLNMEGALDIAVRQSREYQREKENLYLAALRLSDRRNVFASIWTGRANPDIERESDGDVVVQSRQSTQLGVSKRIFRTGGTVTAQLANDMFKYLVGNPGRQVVNTISLSITQPLLRGGGRYNATANSLTQAERDVVYAIRDYSQFQKRFAVDIVKDYLELLGQKTTVRNNYANYESRKSASRRAERRAPIDGKQNEYLARQAELRAKNSYINSITGYQNRLDSFKEKLAIPLSMSVLLDDGPFNELQTAGMLPVDFDAEQAYKIAVEKYYPMLNEIDQFEDAQRRVLVAANSLEAGLDIRGGADLATPTPTEYTDFDPDRVRANMGLVLDLPLNRVNERNAYRSSLIEFERQIRSLARTLDQRRQIIANRLRTLDRDRQNFENNRIGVDIAQRRVDEQKMLIEAGRANQQTLIDAENSLIQTQNERVTSIVSYFQTRLDLLLDTGVIETDDSDFWLQPQHAPMRSVGVSTPTADEDIPPITPQELFKENAP